MDHSMNWETLPIDPDTQNSDFGQSETILRSVSAEPDPSLSQSSSLWMPYDASNSQPQFESNENFQLQGNLDEFGRIYSAGGAGPRVPRPVPATAFPVWPQPTTPQLSTSLIQPLRVQSTANLGRNTTQTFRTPAAPINNASLTWPTAEGEHVLLPSDSDTYHLPGDQITLSNLANHSICNGIDPSSRQIISALRRELRERDHTIEYLTRELEQRQETRADGQNPGGRQRSSPSNRTSDARGINNGNARLVSRRRPFDASARAQTAATRDHGACIRCRRIKKRCLPGQNPDGPCENCTKLSLRYQRIPCIRTHLVQISIFRIGNTENDTWTTRDEVYSLTELKTFSSHLTTRTVYLTHDWGTPLQVAVRQFHPVRGDETVYKWKAKDGTERELATPYYAIANPDETKITLEQYITENLENYKKELLNPECYLVWESFDMASRRAWCGESVLLEKTLRLWMAARLIEKPWCICGLETLGMLPGSDKESPWYQKIPITPMMDTQLDQIVIKHILQPLRKEVLQMLQTKIERFHNRDWFEIFAVIFILLNTIEKAVAHDHEFATMYGHVNARGRRFEDYQLVESYFHAAQALIAHFRDALHGHLPFISGRTNYTTAVKMAELSPEENHFLHELRDYLNDPGRRTAMADLKRNHLYEEPLYWAHQLFLDRWDGQPVHIQEKSETTSQP